MATERAGSDKPAALDKSAKTAKPAKTEKADPPPITIDAFDKPDAEKFAIRYQFQAGEDVRWTVVNRRRIQVTFGGKTQSTETADRSTKCWRIVEVDPDGAAAFESIIEDVDMYQKMTGNEAVRYNSKKDKTPPVGFQDAAKRIGQPLARMILDRQGNTVERTALLEEPPLKEQPQLTIPLPGEPVAVGQTWRQRREVLLPLETGATKKILVEQVFTLKSVKTGVATIDWANQILTPIHSAEIEAKLIERYSHGKIRFDVDAGRVLSQETDLDHRVVGFRGGDSSLHYLTRVTETLLAPKTVSAKNADKPAEPAKK